MKKLFLLLLVMAGALMLKAQSMPEIATPSEKLIVERHKRADGWWETNMIFLAPAEAIMVKDKLLNRQPDSVAVFIRWADTILAKKYWLSNGQSISWWFPHEDELGKYQYLILTCKIYGEKYYLKINANNNKVINLDRFIEVIPDGVYAGYNLVESMLGHFDYTKRISPYSWLNMGMNKRILQEIKETFMTEMATL